MSGIQFFANNTANTLSNILLSNYAQTSSLKLSQAISNNMDVSSASVSNSSTYTTGKISSSVVDFLKQYQNQMLELKNKAEKVLNGGDTSRLTAGAEKISVAEVTGKLSSASDEYTLTVEQMASGQVNRSITMDSESPLPSMSGAMRIETSQGSYDLFMSAAGSENNREMLQNFASKINASVDGVSATVQEKDGKSYLQLEGADGESNVFSVSGALAERLGLDQVSKTGQNAVYTVQKNDGETKRYISDSNTVYLDGNLKATLKGTGTTKIKSGSGEESRLADSVSQMVEQFNSTLSFLNKNGENNLGVLNQIKRMIMLPVSERSMEKIGITVYNDGSLAFDRASFLEQLEENPELTNNLVERVAEGLRSDAQLGMQEKSADLAGGSRSEYTTQQNNNSQIDSLTLFSTYSRSGVYNMLNYYAVGALMNFNV